MNEKLSIPDNEIVFDVSTSSGPGGQHVNRVETRVTLEWNVTTSAVIDDAQRTRISTRLASRINKNGVLQVRSERHRSQHMNRDDAIAKFADLLRDAVEPEVPRKKTRVSRAAKARRLDQKRHRSRIKERRRKTGDES